MFSQKLFSSSLFIGRILNSPSLSLSVLLRARELHEIPEGTEYPTINFSRKGKRRGCHDRFRRIPKISSGNYARRERQLEKLEHPRLIQASPLLFSRNPSAREGVLFLSEARSWPTEISGMDTEGKEYLRVSVSLCTELPLHNTIKATRRRRRFASPCTFRSFSLSPSTFASFKYSELIPFALFVPTPHRPVYINNPSRESEE